MLDHPAKAALTSCAVAGADLDTALRRLGLDPSQVGPVDPALCEPIARTAKTWHETLDEEVIWCRRADLRRLVLWCAETGASPFASRDALPGLIKDYLKAASSMLKPPSLERAGSSLVALTRDMGLSDTMVSERRSLVVSASYRSSRERQTGRKAPAQLTKPQMKALEGAIGKSAGSAMKQARDLAMVRSMAELMLRRSEVRGFRLCDWHRDTGELVICHAKADREGQGASYTLGVDTAHALNQWFSAAGFDAITDPVLLRALPIFPGLYRGGAVRTSRSGEVLPMESKSISRTLADYVEEVRSTGGSATVLRAAVSRLLFKEEPVAPKSSQRPGYRAPRGHQGHAAHP